MADKKIKKIAYLTGTRADFGLMTPVLSAIKKDSAFNLKVFATGMHLMPQFGLTVKEVKKEFPHVVRLNAVFSSDKKKSYKDFIRKLSPLLFKNFSRYKPDLMLVLGDRVEMLCVAIVARFLGIPIAHIHGGDKTTTIDDTMRNLITKLSSLHFPATAQSAKRVKSLGVDPRHIYVVGTPAIDVIKKMPLYSRQEICSRIGLHPKRKFILVTQHPVSENIDGSSRQMKATVEAVKFFSLPTVIIYPNADPGSAAMIKKIENERKNSLFRIFKSLPYKDFLSLEKEAAVWIGNSSAGILESASFGTPVVNIGKRQFARPHGANVLDVGYKRRDIIRAIDRCLFDKKFIDRTKKTKNLWGDGFAAKRITAILKKLSIDKNFYGR